jgi:hypothetical protein
MPRALLVGAADARSFGVEPLLGERPTSDRRFQLHGLGSRFGEEIVVGRRAEPSVP